MTARVSAPGRVVPRWLLKAILAATGLVWTAFVLVHLYGNLKVFSGAETFNEYAHWLRNAFAPLLPPGLLIWLLRAVLLVSLVLHVGCALVLWVAARRSAGRYARVSWRTRLLRGKSSWRALSAALMPFTGLVILAFLVFHIADMTLGVLPAAPQGFLPATSDTVFAYENLLASFTRPWVAGAYVVVMALLSIHVAHGTALVGTDLGARGLRLRAALAWVGGLIGLAILLGNGWIPVAVQLGVIR